MSAQPASSGRIAQAFARCAAGYDAHAQVQLQCAERLAAYIDANSRDLIDGPVLEIGCGTGVLSRKLCEVFPERSLFITDVCEEMLARCQMRLSGASGLKDRRMTFNTLCVTDVSERDAYACLAAAFVLQWLADFSGGLTKLTASLKPGGKLFFSIPESGSFPEWRSICKRAAVRYTGNPLPLSMDIRTFAAQHGLRLGMYQETFSVNYRSLEDFLMNLKLIGASTALAADRLTLTEMRRLLATARKENPNSFTATYKVLFGHMEKLR
jgi:malonyl-CoA O-methyltransferase